MIYHIYIYICSPPPTPIEVLYIRVTDMDIEPSRVDDISFLSRTVEATAAYMQWARPVIHWLSIGRAHLSKLHCISLKKKEGDPKSTLKLHALHCMIEHWIIPLLDQAHITLWSCIRKMKALSLAIIVWTNPCTSCQSPSKDLCLSSSRSTVPNESSSSLLCFSELDRYAWGGCEGAAKTDLWFECQLSPTTAYFFQESCASPLSHTLGAPTLSCLST